MRGMRSFYDKPRTGFTETWFNVSGVCFDVCDWWQQIPLYLYLPRCKEKATACLGHGCPRHMTTLGEM